MFEGLKEALQYVNELKEASMQPIVTEIEGKTYCDKNLRRYGEEDLAEPIYVNTLSAMVDYITGKKEELRENMILHITSPKEVRLYSGLLEERKRETLFVCNAIVNEFQFDKYYDQERFLIELQANFAVNDDLQTIMQVIEATMETNVVHPISNISFTTIRQTMEIPTKQMGNTLMGQIETPLHTTLWMMTVLHSLSRMIM